MNESKMEFFKKKEKREGGFGGEEIKDCETKNMPTWCHMHRK